LCEETLSREVDVMDTKSWIPVLDPVEVEKRDVDVPRQCPTCERCRDCGYTHIALACPDPDPDFDGTCLCDPTLSAVA
jgi:hypothetical protein